MDDEEALRRYERRLEQEYKKNKKLGINTDIKRDMDDREQKSPNLAEKFINFIGCGAKSKPNKKGK